MHIGSGSSYPLQVSPWSHELKLPDGKSESLTSKIKILSALASKLKNYGIYFWQENLSIASKMFQWSQVLNKKQSQVLSSIKCPLCKTDKLSIVHGFNGEFFQRHYISKCPGKSWFSGAHEFRLQWNGNDVEISKGLFDVHKFWKHCRYLQENVWIERWLRREIQVLIQKEDVDIIVHHICGVMKSFKRKQGESMEDATPEEKRKEFRKLLLDAAKPFVLRQAERFICAVELFLASGLNIEAYDKVCMQHLTAMSAAAE